MLHLYEGQVRKFVTQFIRVLSNFSIEMGKGKNGEVNLRQVPVIYGDMTRQVANIIKNNSENFLQSAPRIAAYISGLEYYRDRMQNPSHIENKHLKEKLTELHEIQDKLDMFKKKAQKEKKVEQQKLLAEKTKEVEEKLKSKKKLTTEDLIVFQNQKGG